MVDEAKLEQTPVGSVSRGAGWFVLNLRDARWWRRPGRGHNVQLTGADDEEVLDNFAQLGVNVAVLQPGEPLCRYHWEHEQEGFLVLAGEALLLAEGGTRQLRQWDFAHSPPGTHHALVGSGGGPCTVLAVGSRANFEDPEFGGAFDVDFGLRARARGGHGREHGRGPGPWRAPCVHAGRIRRMAAGRLNAHTVDQARRARGGTSWQCPVPAGPRVFAASCQSRVVRGPARPIIGGGGAASRRVVASCVPCATPEPCPLRKVRRLGR